MKIFEPGHVYGLREILPAFGKRSAWQPSPIWITDYFATEDKLVLFLNLKKHEDRAYHKFNYYDPVREQISAVLKPGSHSAQPVLKAVLDGKLLFEVFARWTGNSREFLYFGCPSISSYEDNVRVYRTQSAAVFMLNCLKFQTTDPKIISNEPLSEPWNERLEGHPYEITLSKFERDPYLRSACISLLGATCSICRFDFEAKYGLLGRGYCHVHHIVPLSAVREEQSVNPFTDLIPVCPNCHAMLHRRRPVLLPSELRELVEQS